MVPIIRRFTSRAKLGIFLIALALASGTALVPLALANPGDLYVTDLSTGSVIRYESDGTPHTFVTGLQSPQGITFDLAKNIYVADAKDGSDGNGVIMRYDLSGVGGVFRPGLSNPVGIDVDGSDLLVSENTPGTNDVLRVPLDGVKPPKIFEVVTSPMGLSSQANEQEGFFRYIAHENFVLQVDPDPSMTTDIDIAVGARGVAIDVNDDVFVSTDAGTIIKIPFGTTQVIPFASGLTMPTGMDFRPAKFTGDVDRVGFLYVGDIATGIITQISGTGVPSTFVASAGQPNYMAFETNAPTPTPTPTPTPMITSPLSAGGVVGHAFSYQITATNSPTSFGASNLPSALKVNSGTGLINGTPAAVGSFKVGLMATNSTGTGNAVLTLTITSTPTPTPSPTPTPAITSPLTATAAVGQSFTYQITASNSPNSFGATNLPANLTVDTSTGLISGTPAAKGSFSIDLSATNGGGTGTATLALTVTATAPSPSPAPKALNISTRVDVETGDDVAIGGFIITTPTPSATAAPAASPKTVVIRAIGPSLGSSGVTGTLSDPVLELHEPDGTVVMNDNWKDNSEEDQGVIVAAGLNLYNGQAISDNEAILVASLPARDSSAGSGQYTAVMHGSGTDTGVGLVEVYDLDDPSTPSELANISTRGIVGTADDVLIGGLIVGPLNEGITDRATVVVRAIGPSLAHANPPVTDPLADPFVVLHNSDGDPIATNDNWKDGADEATIKALGLAPTNDLESAVLANLLPGAYTAVVMGQNGGVGVALVEVFHVPTPTAR